MWGTFILEAYVNHERQRLADALEDICSSRDGYQPKGRFGRSRGVEPRDGDSRV